MANRYDGPGCFAVLVLGFGTSWLASEVFRFLSCGSCSVLFSSIFYIAVGCYLVAILWTLIKPIVYWLMGKDIDDDERSGSG